jgi:hypothetical protein
MKKFMTIFVSALLGFAANAQMMPDSTVNICAYWELGDKYEYRCSESSYSVEGTDTTDVEHSSEIFTIEVIAKEKDSYKLSLTSKDQNSSDEIENVLNSISAANGGDMPLIISTTEMGDIIRVENAQEYCDMLVKAIDPIMEEVGKVKEMSEDEKQMTKAILVEMFADPRVIESMVMDSFGRMLAFHGSRLKIGETYTVEDVATSIFPGVDMPVKAISEYTIKSEDTDDYSAVCEICTSAEKGDVYRYTYDDGDITITYPNGATWWENTSDTGAVGGWSGDYDTNRYIDGSTLGQELTLAYQYARKDWDEVVIIGLLCLVIIGLGVVAIVHPELGYELKYRMWFENVEPTEFALRMSQLTGVIMIVGAVIAFLTVLFR